MISQIKKVSATLFLGFIVISAYPQQRDAMAEAVLKSYEEVLNENPKDYMTLFDRASYYFRMGDFHKALSDLEKAIQYTPDKETTYKTAEYSLQADAFIAQEDYAGAMGAVDAALQIDPGSSQLQYKKGNILLLQNKPEEALKVFQNLQRENSRSQEAFYGMARANVMLGNYEQAESLIKEIEELGKTSYLTYCRIGDLHSVMGKPVDSAKDFITAYTMTEKSNRPLQSLQALSKNHPDVVMSCVDATIESNPENIPLKYLKTTLTFENGNYAEAETACKALLDGMEDKPVVVYRVMAMSQLFQDKINDAKATVKEAELIAPDDYGLLLDKAEILLTDAPAESYAAAKQALFVDPDAEEALMVAAKGAILAGNKDDALSHLNNLIITNPGNIEALLLRGYVYNEMFKDSKNAVTDFTRAGNAHNDSDAKAMALAALGKAKAGKKFDADALVNDAIQNAAGNKDALYTIAVYYVQTSNLEKAKEYADKAKAAGYNNEYNLKHNNEPLFNLSPIHHLLK